MEGNVVRNFCTLFDRNYLYKGAVMLRSLAKHDPGARTFVVCLDHITLSVLTRLSIPGVQTIELREVESDEVLRVKPVRSVAEYCWTLTSVVMWHVMQENPDIDLLTYLDADLMFFSSVEPIFIEMGNASILAVEHRYPREKQHFEMYGRFNVQWVSFRRDQAGMSCLARWRTQCLEWCYARIEGGKHGDQKYLDSWPSDYGDAFHSLQNVGAGLAPWNYANYKLQVRDGRYWVDDSQVIFYHFHQFQILDSGGFSPFRTQYFEGRPPPHALYEHYWSELRGMIEAVRQIDPDFDSGTKAVALVRLRLIASRFLPTGLKNVLKRVGFRA